MEKKLFVGQEVFIIYTNKTEQVVKTKITKIGKKYLEVEQRWMGRFFVETLIQDGRGYSSSYKIYLSEQEITDESEKKTLKKELSKYFEFNTKLKLTTLRKISELIKSDQEGK